MFAADRAPTELAGLGTELSTRLSGGMVCSLEQPDLEARLGLAKQFGGRLGIELADDVAEFIGAQIICRSARDFRCGEAVVCSEPYAGVCDRSRFCGKEFERFIAACQPGSTSSGYRTGGL